MKRVLIVEDEPDLRAVLRDIAEMISFNVTEAENGLLGIEKLRSQSFDLILSDIRMPLKDGLQLLREFREFNKETPFFILTAFDEISEHQIYFLKGNGIFYKPINAEALTQFFEKHT